jgi:cyclin A
VNDSEETQKAELCAPREEPTALLENKGSLSLQNIDWNRLSGFHEAFFQGRNTRDNSETSDSKNG